MSVHDYSPKRFAAYTFSQLPFLGDSATATSIALARAHNKFLKDKGFYKVWVNNELKYEFSGPTTKGNESYFKFGIYHTWINRWDENKRGPFPTQVVYYDEVRVGKSREAVTKHLGY